MDTLTGTTNNDTFIGYVTSAATGTTLSAVDKLVGGSGTDVLNITVDGTATATTNGADISGIETINVRNVGTGAAAIDASTAIGVTDISSDRSTGTLAVTNMATGSSFTVIGNGTVANGNTGFQYKTTTDAVTLNVKGGTTAGNIAVGAVGGAASGTATSATINSTGAANVVGTVDLANATLTSVTVNAATNLKGDFLSQGTDQVAANGSVTISGAATSVEFTAALDNDIKTIDASGLTAGGLTAALGTGVTSFKGGQGNDVVTTAAIATTASVDAGAGTADVIVVGAGTDTDSAAKAAVYKNFEVVRTGASQDMSVFTGSTIGAVQVNAGTDIAISKMTATQAANVTVRGDIAAGSNGGVEGLELSLADATGTADVATITFGGAGLAPTPDAAKLTVNGFETLNLKAVQGTTATDLDTTIAAVAADKVTAVNLTGTSFAFTDVAGFAKAVTIDGSALTGYLKVAGNLTAGSTVTATAGKDTAALGTVGSTYNLGANDDSITATAVTQLRSGTTYNTVDAGAGVDTLTLTANDVTMIDDDFKGLTNLEKIVLTVNGATNGETITTGGWYDQNFKAAGSDLTITAGAEAVTFAGGTFTGVQKLAVTTTAATQATTLQTGSGADTVTVTAASTTSGVITVKTGAGNDTITVTDGTATTATNSLIVEAGTGADTVALTVTRAASALNAVQYVVNAGDSTTTAFDKVTGMAAANGTYASDYIDFTGTGTVAANATAVGITGYTAGELTYTITNGIMTFAGSKAAALTAEQMISIVDTAITANTATVLFVNGNDSYVYNTSTSGDSVVDLVGLNTITALTATLNTTTANTFAIA